MNINRCSSNVVATKSISNVTPFQKELELYKNIYDLSIFFNKDEVSNEFYEYCKCKKDCIVVVLYNNEGKVYLKQSGLNSFILPGGSLDTSVSIRDSVNEVVKSINKAIQITELEPIALFNNIYTNRNQSTKHTGIAVLARVSQKCSNSIPMFEITPEILEKIQFNSNYKILKLFQRRFKKMVINNDDFQDYEIETNQRYHLRYLFHNLFVKRFILTDKLKRKAELHKLLIQQCSNAKNAIDVSCGDNSILFDIIDYTELDYMIANDISWSQIELIKKRPKVLFTDHNALTFPFKDSSFDFVYCSNTLHHMANRENIMELIKSLIRISSKKVMIFEIENPTETGGFPYLLNKYWYRGFLKDAGEEFLNYKEFKTLVISACIETNNIKITFSNFENIQGNYMIAILEKI